MKAVNYILFLILFLSAILRLYNLGNMPSGTTNDEAGIIYSAYSIFKTGHDITGKFLPVSFNLDNSFSPVYIYITAPFVGLLGVSPFSGRLPFALLGIASVLLLFLISKKLFKNNTLALGAAFTLAISPWHIHISRAAYDAPVALFFYLLAIYIFVVKIDKGKIWWSLPAFFLAFYSYHATKVFFIFFIPLLIFLHRDVFKERKKELLIFALGVAAILISFFIVSRTQGVSRQSVFIWSDNESAAKTVNWERDKNIAPFKLREIFSNKPLYYLHMMRDSYFEAFSLEFLFIRGETGGLAGIYGTYFMGVMHIIELPLLVLGFIFFINLKDKKLKYFIFASLLISPLASTFTADKTYVMRSVMMLPFLSIIVGGGISWFASFLAAYNKIIKFIIIMVFVLIYTFLLGEYLYLYHFRYPVYAGENWFGSDRQLLNYVKDNDNNYQNTYIIVSGDMFILQYALLNKIDPRFIQTAWSSSWPKKIEKVSFLQGCIDTKGKVFDPKMFLPDSTLYVVPESCHKETTPKKTISDVGEPLRIIWKIYEKR